MSIAANHNNLHLELPTESFFNQDSRFFGRDENKGN